MKSHLSPACTISTASARSITSRLRGRREEREGERRREEREEGKSKRRRGKEREREREGERRERESQSVSLCAESSLLVCVPSWDAPSWQLLLCLLDTNLLEVNES